VGVAFAQCAELGISGVEARSKFISLFPWERVRVKAYAKQRENYFVSTSLSALPTLSQREKEKTPTYDFSYPGTNR
jgi:hypothetical protein